MSPRSELNSKRAVPFWPLLLAIKLSKYVVNRKWKHHLPGMKISQSAIFYEDTIRWSPSISSSSSSILLGREVDRYFSIKTTDWRISSFCLYNYCQPIKEHFWQRTHASISEGCTACELLSAGIHAWLSSHSWPNLLLSMTHAPLTWD